MMLRFWRVSKLHFIDFGGPVWGSVFNINQHKTIPEGGLGGQPGHEPHENVAGDESRTDFNRFRPEFSQVLEWISHGFGTYSYNFFADHIRASSHHFTINHNRTLQVFGGLVPIS